MELEQRVERLEQQVAELRHTVAQMASQPAKASGQGFDGVPGEVVQIAGLAQQMARGADGQGDKPLVVVGRFTKETIGMLVEEEAVLREKVDPAELVRILTIMASEPRMRIMQALLTEEKSAADVGAAIGLEGGPLYHHLAELQKADIIKQPGRGRYALTNSGTDLFYYLAAVQIYWRREAVGQEA